MHRRTRTPVFVSRTQQCVSLFSTGARGWCVVDGVSSCHFAYYRHVCRPIAGALSIGLLSHTTYRGMTTTLQVFIIGGACNQGTRNRPPCTKKACTHTCCTPDKLMFDLSCASSSSRTAPPPLVERLLTCMCRTEENIPVPSGWSLDTINCLRQKIKPFVF